MTTPPQTPAAMDDAEKKAAARREEARRAAVAGNAVPRITIFIDREPEYRHLLRLHGFPDNIPWDHSFYLALKFRPPPGVTYSS